MKWRGAMLLSLLLGCGVPPVLAHSLGASYLSLRDVANTPDLSGRWEIALVDVNGLVDLDVNADGALTWGEIRSQEAQIAAVALPGLDLRRANQSCAPRITGVLLNERSDGFYLVLDFAAACPTAGELQVAERLLFERDRSHRAVLAVSAGDRQASGVLTPDQPAWRDSSSTGAAGLQAFTEFFREGTWHIWIGYDHIAFLVLLLLPVVLRPERGGWRAAESWRTELWSAVRIVSAFTLAHSLTLSLAALGILQPPERPVEMLIAASVACAGLLNLFPVAARYGAWIAFGFGLIHGFGFAAVLGELGLESTSLLWSLLGFNLGVEAGQLAIVGALLPLLHVLRGSAAYRRGVVPATSIVVGLLALTWLFERAT